MSLSGYQVRGSWEYVGTDGAVYRTEFVADRGGYRPRWEISCREDRFIWHLYFRTFRLAAVGRTGRRQDRQGRRILSGLRKKKKGSRRG